LALQKQAADELGSDDLSGVGEEFIGEMLGKRGGYGSGLRYEWKLLSSVKG